VTNTEQYYSTVCTAQ